MGKLTVLQSSLVYETRFNKSIIKILQLKLEIAEHNLYESKQALQQSGEWADGEIDKLINDRS